MKKRTRRTAKELLNAIATVFSYEKCDPKDYEATDYELDGARRVLKLLRKRGWADAALSAGVGEPKP